MSLAQHFHDISVCNEEHVNKHNVFLLFTCTDFSIIKSVQEHVVYRHTDMYNAQLFAKM